MQNTEQENKTWGMLSHLSGLIGFLGPLIVWLVKKDTMPVVDREAKEALNFQITILIAYILVMVVGFVLSMVHLGLLALFLPLLDLVILAAWLIFLIMGAVTANKGEPYRYPFALRLIQ